MLDIFHKSYNYYSSCQKLGVLLLLHAIFFVAILPSIQNATIEERVALLEIQVTDLVQNVADLDQDVNFLFDEQITQDERLFNLEQSFFMLDEDVEGI